MQSQIKYYILKDALPYFFQIFWKGLEYPTGKLYIPNLTQEYEFPFNWKRIKTSCQC